jgi:hypothetical protein
MKEVQAAAHCLTQAAEHGGPVAFGVMPAINRHVRSFAQRYRMGTPQAGAGPMTDREVIKAGYGLRVVK